MNSDINHDAIREQASDMITNLIIAQVQLFVELCHEYGIDRTSLSSVTKEYCERVRIGGLKIKKPKATGWVTMEPGRQSHTHSRDARQSAQSQLTYFRDTSTINADGVDVRIYRNMKLDDGSYPAIGDTAGDRATFAISYTEGKGFDYRKLDDEDAVILDTYQIPYSLA